MQIKYGFKKEWCQFTRTFRLGGIILALVSFAIADPLMYKLIDVMMETITSGDMFAGIAAALTSLDAEMAMDMNDMMNEMSAMYNNARLIYAVTNAEFCSTSVLIICLILMSTAGGEQKKRATIIPACSGLEYVNYLIPKFVLYPATVFVLSFLSSLIAGLICNAVFTENLISGGMLLLSATLCGVYVAFIVAVFLSVGICTSRPGVTVVFIYIGSTLIELILSSLELTKYHPFALRSLITGQMADASFVLADNVASIAVGVILSVVLGVVMFFLALGVLNAKKINNQEDAPEF